MRALVIDDSEVARAQLRALLTDAGIEVFEQPSAIGATRTITHNGIDAAVVDVSMPGLSGDKLVGVLRKNPRLQHLVIVVVSAKPPVELNAIAESCGADAVLSKDEAQNELVPVLLRLHQQKSLFRSLRGTHHA